MALALFSSPIAPLIALTLAMTFAGCTTFVAPTACERGSTSCAGIQDARFCENVALAVAGKDCDALGLVPGKPFCVVTTQACRATSYVARNGDCRVVRYEVTRDRMSADCAPGTPMFVDR